MDTTSLVNTFQKSSLLDEELKDLALEHDDNDDDTTYTYFIKDEEDEYGNKLNHKNE